MKYMNLDEALDVIHFLTHDTDTPDEVQNEAVALHDDLIQSVAALLNIASRFIAKHVEVECGEAYYSLGHVLCSIGPKNPGDPVPDVVSDIDEDGKWDDSEPDD